MRISATFKNISDEDVNPSTVALYVMDPSGNTDTYLYEESPTDIANDSVGNYYKDIEVDEAGDWHYRWVSTGTGQGSEPGQFVVAPNPIP